METATVAKTSLLAVAVASNSQVTDSAVFLYTNAFLRMAWTADVKNQPIVLFCYQLGKRAAAISEITAVYICSRIIDVL